MDTVKYFLKENQEETPNVKFVATTKFKDEEGNPLEWEFKQLTADEMDLIRESCIKKTKTGKKGHVTTEIDNIRLVEEVIVSSTVYPNLNSKILQDSYGVREPGKLLKKMVYTAAEYAKLSAFIININKLNELEEDIEEAKND